MKILFIGDIVGAPGRQALSDYLPRLKQQYKPQVTIANGENASGGRGLSEKNYKELKTCGVDIVTMGNHTWDHREIYDY
ncbi:YmdB family metallophosphoesterase, partial [Dolosigranulum pigrum]